ncbi:Tol-Pal system beta propeller repeat protein TolB [Psychromarinibacter sp. C21-152]|uniref:Tol-Pal system protein TolB n=2 Tax=Psychromarinibacter sediminicola TaxID=3033385 RepID=A0AAE3T893_9RHOB|nr:Tol-Pal system beta propeller repeat protein TolB [Psychromarinibacter sediminicola]MDF0599844.1 Tol-Pal system beta propeller repeat protein TolB [Psychromarinibacter sediminicola]
MIRLLILTLALGLAAAGPAAAQERGPLRIEITEGVIEPLPFAIPQFVPENPGAAEMARQITRVVSADLTGTGLFREIPRDAYISDVTSFQSPVQYSDWKAINAQALITGAVQTTNDGRVIVKFRLFDVFAENQLGDGLQFAASQDSWRRMAHKVADAVYSRITGEGAYFDSRVVFVASSGPKDARRTRLAIMDYDGANVEYLTDSGNLVLAPRFSPDGKRVLYTSYETGSPRIHILDVDTVERRVLEQEAGAMSVGPSFTPDGNKVIYSLARGGNSDLYELNLQTGATRQLTSAPSIETSPSVSPDGRFIVFESDRSGSQQLYVMPAGGGEARRISSGAGRYGAPVWSPRGDMIAFVKQNKGRFHIGVMRTDGSEERLLTASFLDESPTWSPNGRVIMFTRESQGASGQPSLYSVDITGRNLRRVPLETAASDPTWSPLLQ